MCCECPCVLTCSLSVLCEARRSHPWRSHPWRSHPCPYWGQRAAHSPILTLTWQEMFVPRVLGGVTTAHSVPGLGQVMADGFGRWSRPDALCQPGPHWSGVDGSFLSYPHITGLYSSRRIPSLGGHCIPPKSIPLSTVLPHQSQWSRGAKKAEGLERMSLVHPLLRALAWAAGASGGDGGQGSGTVLQELPRCKTM